MGCEKVTSQGSGTIATLNWVFLISGHEIVLSIALLKLKILSCCLKNMNMKTLRLNFSCFILENSSPGILDSNQCFENGWNVLDFLAYFLGHKPGRLIIH